MSSESRGDAFMIAWASVDVGVYGFSAIRSRAFRSANGSVFRALFALSRGQSSNMTTHGITACSSPHVLCSIRRRSNSSCEARVSGLSSYSAILADSWSEFNKGADLTYCSRHICLKRGANPVSGSRRPAKSSFMDWPNDRTSAYRESAISCQLS
jgi:hypothetical protein